MGRVRVGDIKVTALSTAAFYTGTHRSTAIMVEMSFTCHTPNRLIKNVVYRPTLRYTGSAGLPLSPLLHSPRTYATLTTRGIASFPQVEVMQTLLKNDTSLNFNAADLKGRSPAHVAAQFDYVDALAALTESLSPAPPSPSTTDGEISSINDTVTDIAGHRCSPPSAINLNAKDLEGRTPLHYASVAGNSAAVTFLCDAGANVDAIDSFGRTSAWQATVEGKVRGPSFMLFGF